MTPDSIKILRVCFDIDNTLVTEPQIQGDYSTVKPIDKNILFLKFLKSQNVAWLHKAERERI